MTPVEVRAAAASECRSQARVAAAAGDDETAEQMRDLARTIDRMRITVDLWTGEN